jgi:hypothetical protein
MILVPLGFLLHSRTDGSILGNGNATDRYYHFGISHLLCQKSYSSVVYEGKSQDVWDRAKGMNEGRLI